jgi:hypothetical protein
MKSNLLIKYTNICLTEIKKFANIFCLVGSEYIAAHLRGSDPDPVQHGFANTAPQVY